MKQKSNYKPNKLKKKYLTGTQQTVLDNDTSYQNAQSVRDKSTTANQQAAGTTAGVASNFGPVGQIVAAGVGVSQSAKIKNNTTDKYGISQSGLDPNSYNPDGTKKSGFNSKAAFNDSVEDTGTGVIKNIKTGDYGKAALTAFTGPLGGTIYRAAGGKTNAERAYETQTKKAQYIQNQSNLTKNYNGNYSYQADQIKNGMKKIHIKPENKGKFNATKKATGETTEQLTHSSNPITKKRAIFAQNASHWNHSKKELGSKGIIGADGVPSKTFYKPKKKDTNIDTSFPTKLNKGARQIETEGREPIFTPKKKDGKRDLIYYNPNDPTHKDGGVDALVVKKNEVSKVKDKTSKLVVPENSAIVTAKNQQNIVAMDAYKKGNFKKLNKVIDKMPDDKKSKKALGDSSVEGLGTTKSSLGASEASLYSGASGGAGSLGSASVSNKSSFGSKLSGIGNTGAALAPTIYNLAQGALGSTTKTNRRTYTPDQYNYRDMSDPSRRAANEAYSMNQQNILKGSGGNASSYLANNQQAGNTRYKQLSDINNFELGRRQDINNSNVDLKNQAQNMNLGLQNQYDQLDLQNKAKKSEYTARGLEGLSNYAQQSKLDSNRKTQDDRSLKLMQTGNYKYNSDSGEVEPKKNGSKKLQLKMDKPKKLNKNLNKTKK